MTPAEVTDVLRHYSEWQKSNGSILRIYSTKEINKAIDAAVEMIERMAKMESALEEVLNSGLLSGQYTIHDKMADLVRAALEKSK